MNHEASLLTLIAQFFAQITSLSAEVERLKAENQRLAAALRGQESKGAE